MNEPIDIPSEKTELPAVREAGAVATRQPTIIELIAGVVKTGITPENATVIEKLAGIMERQQDRDAAKEFASAFVKLQQEIPKIKATKFIPDKNGHMRSSFAPFEEIDTQARPICLANGFTYSFGEKDSPAGKITKVCTLSHVGGHSRSNTYTVRIGSGPPGCSESQSDGSAHSYAKRGALCDSLNIVVSGMDNDARALGAPVTEAQAFELERRVKETNANVAAFLKFAGAAKFSEIPSTSYDMLDRFLAAKEGRR